MLCLMLIGLERVVDEFSLAESIWHHLMDFRSQATLHWLELSYMILFNLWGSWEVLFKHAGK